jgi:hypothetical protein
MIAVSGGVAGEAPAAHRDPVPGDRHRDHHLRQIGPVVLGVAEGAPAGLVRAGELVVGARIGQLGVAVGGLDLPVGARGVHEHDVQIKIQQVGDRGEDLRGDLVEGVEEEVHRPVGLIIAEPRAALDRHPLGDPPGRRELAARFQRPLGDQREHHPLGRLPVQPAPGRGLADRRPDAQPPPQPVQDPRPAEAARVHHLHRAAPGGGRGLLRGEEPRDRRHQPGQALPVDLVGPPEVVDHLGDRVPGLREPLVVRQLQVAHHRAVLVRPPTLPQVHRPQASSIRTAQPV